MTVTIHNPFIILVDTREQTPWTWEGVETVQRSLPAGDYSVLGLEDHVVIERKSLNDYVNTLLWSKDRFREELKKLIRYEHRCIVVEATIEDIVAKRYTSRATPSSLIGITMGLLVNWQIPVHFWSNRQIAMHLARLWLERIWRAEREVIDKAKLNAKAREVSCE